MEQYNYTTVLSKYRLYEVQLVKQLLYYDEEDHALDITAFDSKDWGAPSSLVEYSPEMYPLPCRIELRWVALLDGKCFEIAETLDKSKADELWKQQQSTKDPFKQYIIGIAPYGGVAIWLCSNEKSVLLQWLTAQESQLTEEEMLLFSPRPEREAFVNRLMPLKKLQSDMRQYCYRFIPLEEYFDGEKWLRFDQNSIFYNAIDLDGVQVKRLDGSFNFSDSDELLCYNSFGKPQRITVKWQEDGASYLAHFWLDETIITSFFDSLFNTFPDAKADLLLRLDTRANRYEIAMTGEGLPVRTLKYTQYIVFKDFEEISRSANYTKKEDEWHWF